MINSNYTPCEELGYKVGDKFEILESVWGFKKGQIITLYEDDCTYSPLFSGYNTEFDHCDGEPGAYVSLNQVKKIEEEENR